MKKTVNLTENDLHNLIKESVLTILSEGHLRISDYHMLKEVDDNMFGMCDIVKDEIFNYLANQQINDEELNQKIEKLFQKFKYKLQNCLTPLRIRVTKGY